MARPKKERQLSNGEDRVERLKQQLEYSERRVRELGDQNYELMRVIKYYEAQFEHARMTLSMIPIPISYGTVMSKEIIGAPKKAFTVTVPIKP